MARKFGKKNGGSFRFKTWKQKSSGKRRLGKPRKTLGTDQAA